MSPPADLLVVGAGIVGLATARAWALAHPGAEVVVVDKEPAPATHQTGRNSGVVHAGVYYPPGSLKARLCTEGRARLEAYAAARGLPYERVGKVVVATTPAEVEGLPELFRRASTNGVPGVRLLTADELSEVEPHVRGLAALHSPATAITDFAAVAAAYADDLRESGGRVVLRFEVTAIEQRHDRAVVRAADGRTVAGHRVVLCAGLWSDRLARLAGDARGPAIVPFRGDYFRLAEDRRELVRGLVYPVPDPRYPFLGVHLTRTVHGDVLVGPNAVLAPGREGYRLAAARPRELLGVLREPGFRRLARVHWRTGARELWQSMSPAAFAAAARRFVPELTAADLQRAPAGIRAQALDDDGTLVDDFRISRVGRVVAIRNAPSPAATSSIALADEIVRRLSS
ncbi:MAG TPA: L-2-hydroxyglutarate oxidase [Mycobacteriales bacterium]|nr:L-2-hydroxyglutarate oxidase [Mycobacteriales bacterium]